MNKYFVVYEVERMWKVKMGDRRSCENFRDGLMNSGYEAYLFGNTPGFINEPGIREAIIERMAETMRWSRRLSREGDDRESEGSPISIASIVRETITILFGPDAVDSMWDEAVVIDEEKLREIRESRPVQITSVKNKADENMLMGRKL
jgi:hypothetical protein